MLVGQRQAVSEAEAAVVPLCCLGIKCDLMGAQGGPGCAVSCDDLVVIPLDRAQNNDVKRLQGVEVNLRMRIVRDVMANAGQGRRDPVGTGPCCSDACARVKDSNSSLLQHQATFWV